MASLSDSDTLEAYKLARDSIVTAMQSGDNLVEYFIGSRRKRVTDPMVELRFCEQMITHYQARVDAASSGRARNYANIHRR